MDSDFSAYIQKFASGDIVFNEGDEGSTMYFIHAGEIRIEKKVDDRAETLATLQKGDFFGEMSLLEQSSRSATAVATMETELLVVNSENFEKLLQSNIEIAVRMIRKYISRLRETNERLHHALSLKNKLDQEILEFVKAAPEPAKNEKEMLKPIGLLEVASQKFFLYEGESVIGRIDPATGLTPDIDLTAYDPEKTVSRKHAKIKSNKSGLFEILEELGVRNGTFVNGKKIQAGTYVSLATTDTLQLGKVTLRLSKTSVS